MNKKVFIIEDDINILHSLNAKFNSHGISTLTENGHSKLYEVIHRIILEKPDFIILDLILPELDGFEILGKIKSEGEISSIPIFIFSDMSEDDVKSKCEMLGSDYYFLKQDFNIDQFVVKIFKILKNKHI